MEKDELAVIKGEFKIYSAQKRMFKAVLQVIELIQHELNGLKGIQYDKDIHITVSELDKALRRQELYESKEKALKELARLQSHISYVENLIDLMDAQEKEIICLHYIEDVNHDEIGKKYGLSKMQVRTKIDNILLKTFEKTKIKI